MKKQRKRKTVFSLTLTAAMVALSVVLTRYLGFSPEGTPFRVEIGFLPIGVLAYALGPVYSGIAYVLADAIGSLLSGYAPNLWITASQLLAGIIMGVAFYKKDHTFRRTVVTFSIIGVFIEILVKSPVFIFIYDWTLGFTFITRSINALINLPLRIVAYYLLIKGIKEPIKKYL